LRERTNLVSVFALVDIRVKPMDSDIEFIQMLGENAIPFQIVFTKTDQLKQREAVACIKKYQEVLSERWEELPGMLVSSAKKGRGRNEILTYIDENNSVFLNNLDLSQKG
jgi:GTP-binding protein